MKRAYSRVEEVENVSIEYFVVEGDGFGVGIMESLKDGRVETDIVYDIFPTLEKAENMAITLANHTVFAMSLREILCDYFIGEIKSSA